MINVLVIDKHLMVGKGLTYMFHPSRDGIRIIKCLRNVDEALSLSPSSIDVIIIEWFVNHEPQFDYMVKLKRIFYNNPIIIFTLDQSRKGINKLSSLGVSAYLNKNAEKKEIKETILNISNVRKTYSYFYSNKSFSIYDCNHQKNIEHITIKQKELVNLLSSGFQLVEISQKLNSSPSNIANTLRSLRVIYSANSNSELIKILFREGQI